MMTTKKDLALVADAVISCGLSGGASVDEIIAFAKKQRSDPAWIAALKAAAKGKKYE